MTTPLDEMPDPEARARRLGKSLREQTSTIADLEHQLAVVRDELVAARGVAAEHLAVAATARAERDHALAHAHALRGAADELAAIQATKLLRWSAAPRRVYGRVRTAVLPRRRR